MSTNSCNTTQQTSTTCGCGNRGGYSNAFVIIIVLYILLAIIIGSCLY